MQKHNHLNIQQRVLRKISHSGKLMEIKLQFSMGKSASSSLLFHLLPNMVTLATFFKLLSLASEKLQSPSCIHSFIHSFIHIHSYSLPTPSLIWLLSFFKCRISQSSVFPVPFFPPCSFFLKVVASALTFYPNNSLSLLNPLCRLSTYIVPSISSSLLSSIKDNYIIIVAVIKCYDTLNTLYVSYITQSILHGLLEFIIGSSCYPYLTGE
jgi:hypothetical protein